jgi:hypothetical protein
MRIMRITDLPARCNGAVRDRRAAWPLLVGRRMRPSDRLARRVTRSDTRARRALVAACVVFLGCDVGTPPPPPTREPARALFEARAWPALGPCIGCHRSQPTIDFLAPGTAEGAYATMFAFQPPVVDVESPASSLLLAMGKHTGPALLPEAAAGVLEWLEAEREERIADPDDPISIGPVAVELGVPTIIPLLADGATLQFVATDAGGALSLEGLELRAGPRGLHAVHPVFSSKPATGAPVLDAVDRYREVDLDLDPNIAVRLGGGAALFTKFPPTDPISIHFRTLEAP